MKDATATMGDLLPDDVDGRDAVHVAVIAAVAGETLTAGQRVVTSGVIAVREFAGGAVGIVDPYLTREVMPGDRFWIFLLPRSITSLRHQWTHPSFDTEVRNSDTYLPPAQRLASEQWLRDFCARSDCPSYYEVMGAAERVADAGWQNDVGDEYLHFNGSDVHGEIPPEFWDHVAVVLGRKINGKRAKYFSCSC